MGCSAQKRSKTQQPTTIQRFSKQNIQQYFRFGRILGSGSFGTVKLAYSLEQEKNGGEVKQYAVKTIDKMRVGSNFYLIQRELEILATLDHPNIIRVYEEYEDQRYYHFVMEYCKGGDLLERIIKNGVFSERKTFLIMKQIFSAVQYIHEQGITHRDLKPENLILVSPDNDLDIRIIDFGLSKKYADNSSAKLRTQMRHQSKVGTPIYVAPEVLSGVYSSICDEWSLGCIMYVLFCGEPPFCSADMKQLEQKIKTDIVGFKQNAWKNITQEAKCLISQLLEKNPKKRITCAQALQSDWVQKMESKIARESLHHKPTEENKSDEQTISLLKSYANLSKLKKEALKILLNQLNETQILSLRKKFEEFDKDGSGTISIDEIAEIMKQNDLKDTYKEIEQMMHKLAIRQSNSKHYVIKYSEFISALLNNQTYLNQERLWILFKQFDSDNKNYITRDDFKKIMERRGKVFSDTKLELIFSEIEVQQISFDQFCSIMQKDIVNTEELSRRISQPTPGIQQTSDF
ncbi:hypothetical protein pb186bvf_001147 [Paramecium bursaria]